VSEVPTLLIVDDEARIVTALRRCLRKQGYEIHSAESPQAGLLLLAEHSFDLVLSDQKMPGMNGLDFLAEAARQCPGAALVLITGWPEAAPPARLEQIGVGAVIQKPWDDAQLKATLRRLLEAG
jgi:DNA-binding NtrC family response regulator